MAKKPPIFDTPFDTYTSSGVIGEGGAGRVYVVTNSAGEEFALKCLAPERITSTRLRRFKNEIHFCQHHDHPNIIRVVDTGSISIEGVKCPFYVMNRYSGTLRTLIGNLGSNDRMMLFAQILNGVEAAHLTKVWHRDLKPENLLYEQREKRILVADFGIAHFEEEEIFTAVETRAIDRLANFHYSAPEQRVRNAKVDHRADIFALGLILNELFTGEILQGAGYKKIANVTNEYAYLDDLVELMTQQDPANRPESIEQIKKELIGRKNAFISLQKYEESKKQVISAAESPDFKPIQIVSFDYESGFLNLQLSGNVPLGWAEEFQHPRSGHSAMVGYEPDQFGISGDKISIGVRGDERYIQEIVNHAKDYVKAANQGFVRQMREHAIKTEQQQRAASEKKVAQAEMRKNILANVKL